MFDFKRVLFVVFGLMAIGASPGAEESAFEAGARALREGNAGLAVKEFEKVLAAGGDSPGGYHNLGIALRAAGESGRAILAVRRSLMLEPRSKDAWVELSSLERANGIVRRAMVWNESVAEVVPVSLLLVAGFVIFWVGLFLVVAAFWRRRGWGPFLPGVVSVLLGLGIFSVGYLSDLRFAWRDAAVVVSGEPVVMRQEPVERSEVVARLAPGYFLEQVRSTGGWVYGRLSDGRRGWIPERAVERLVPEQG